VVRPTGLLDPTIEIQPTENQIPHLLEQIKARTLVGERVIVTTLTKRMAENLTEHLAEQKIKVNYLHSEIKTLDRLTILKDFRSGVYDVIVGVNLLREGLDMPEVSLIAILDADKEGFLRNTTTLIQTMGRAARNVNGHVVMYADKRTKSIEAAIQETQRRRLKQEAHNKEHGITPITIKKNLSSFDLPIAQKAERADYVPNTSTNRGRRDTINQLTKAMERAIRKMDYEEAMVLREQIQRLKHGEY
ncbi:MAG: UvrB/UvrC motif-containing protein, partial [Candidatus Yanofskybacteria bacterium]|nr:UvrB/UvrC motif-containing protein [Candidatus Yanofskybacteria bacterium]